MTAAIFSSGSIFSIFGIVSGDQRTRSFDGGVTWESVTTFGAGGNPSTVYGTPRGTWIAGDNNTNRKLYRSTNNGATWSAPITSNLTLGVISAISSDSNNNWIVATDQGQFATSSDDGITWTRRTPSLGNIFCITNDQSGNWAAGGEDIITSTDNGATWTSRTNPFGSSDINSISTDGTNWVAVGDNAAIARSTNSGVTWSGSLITNPYTTENLQGVRNYNGTFVVSTQNTGFIRSSDGGASWSSIIETGAGGLGLEVSNTGIFTSVNSTGQAYSSSNGGVTWSSAVTTGISSTSSRTQPITSNAGSV